LTNHFPLTGHGYAVEAVDRFVGEVYDRMQAAIQRFREMETELSTLRSTKENLERNVTTIAGDAAEKVVEEARQQAFVILANADLEAREKIMSAQAEARNIVAAERAKVAEEVEMLSEIRDMVIGERDALVSFHTTLHTRLTDMMSTIVAFNAEAGGIDALLEIGRTIPKESSVQVALEAVVDEPELVEEPESEPEVDLTPLFPSLELLAAGLDWPSAPQVDDSAPLFDDGQSRHEDHSSLFDDVATPAASASPQPPAPFSPPSPPESVAAVLDEAQRLNEEAFESFFANEVEPEPSRRWLLGDR
jgi:cell division septum initiation protein DivIVA